eukprot:1484725-Pleurochrysis_carterae.AAC.3
MAVVDDDSACGSHAVWGTDKKLLQQAGSRPFRHLRRAERIARVSERARPRGLTLLNMALGS